MDRKIDIAIRYGVPVALITLFLSFQGTSELTEVWKTLFYLIGGTYALMLLIVDLDPQYWGFLKVFIKVHVFKKHLDLKKKDIYQAYIDRVKMLSKETGNWWAERKLKWEISLTEKIIEESGWYTEKYTGKFNNKYQPKIRKDGEVMVRQKHKGDRFKKKLRKPRRGK